MQRNRGLVLALVFLVFLSGCLGESVSLAVPPSDIPLEQIVDANLKQLDLNRMSKTKITAISGVELPEGARSYEIKYRHPDQPITVIIAKFADAKAAEQFWSKWADARHKANPKLPKPGKLAEGGGYWSYRDRQVSVLAWEKDVWFTSVTVPVAVPQADQLKEKVKDVIVLHYSSLGKQHQKK